MEHSRSDYPCQANRSTKWTALAVGARLGVRSRTRQRLAAGLWGGALFSVSLLFAPLTAIGQERGSYVSVDSYTRANPDQIGLMAGFSETVRKTRPPQAAPDGKAVRIALIYPGLQASDYWRRSVASFEARLKAAGQPYVLNRYFTKPNVEVRKQAARLTEALQQNPDYLVFTLDAQRHKFLIERVLTRGQPKLILQNITTPLKAWRDTQPFLYVGFDHQTGTRILANHFIKTTNGKGDYAVVCWSRGYISEMRGETFVQALHDQPQMNLKAFFYAGTTRQAGQQAALEALNDFANLKFIYACSTDLALGVAQALRTVNRQDSVMVNGWGGGSAELTALQEGTLDVTVMRMNDDNGVAMADAIVLDQSGRTKMVPTVYSGNLVLITNKTPQATVRDLKARAFRYSGQ